MEAYKRLSNTAASSPVSSSSRSWQKLPHASLSHKQPVSTNYTLRSLADGRNSTLSILIAPLLATGGLTLMKPESLSSNAW